METLPTEIEACGLAIHHHGAFLELEKAQRIDERHFDDRLTRRVWSTVQSLIDSGAAVTTRSVRQAIKPKDSELEIWTQIIASGVSLAHASHTCEELLRHHLRRQAYEACKAVMDALVDESNPKALIEGLVDTLSEHCSGIDHDGERTDFRTAKEVAMETVNHLEEIQRDPGAIGYHTGVGELDRVVRLIPGSLNVICARPSLGKSALMLQMATSIARETPTAIFSLEMTAIEQGLRFLCSRTSLNSNDVMAGKPLSRGQHQGIMAAAGEMAGLSLLVRDCSSLTLGQIKYWLGLLARKGVKVVFLDYLSLVKTPRSQERRIELGNVTRSLKAMAKQFSLAIVILSQLNRDADGKGEDLTLSNLAETDDISRDANVIIAIGADENLYVLKNRGASTGRIWASFDRPNQTFRTYRSEDEKFSRC